MHNTQMIPTAVIGAAGFSGQETLDRVLVHPDLELVALGSDSLVAGGVVVDAKSGVSGAGRALKASSHAAAVLENVVPYRVGTHQHEPEIEQLLGFPVCLVPHLLPVRRGLIATCYVQATGDLRA